MPIRWHTGEDEQSGFAVMDVTERLSDRGSFLAETFVRIKIKGCTSLNYVSSPRLGIPGREAEGGC